MFWIGLFVGIILTFLGQGINFIVSDALIPNQERYSRQNADISARQHLWEFSRQKNIPIWEFEGPYFSPYVGMDYMPYNVWYKHPKYYFYHDDWHNRHGGILKSRVKKIIPSPFEWLEGDPKPFDENASTVTTQDKLALKGSREKLLKYAKTHKINVHDFNGPFIKKNYYESDGTRSYRICYKHPNYYFCYTAVVFPGMNLSDSDGMGINILTDRESPFKWLDGEPALRSAAERNTPWETWITGSN